MQSHVWPHHVCGFDAQRRCIKQLKKNYLVWDFIQFLSRKLKFFVCLLHLLCLMNVHTFLAVKPAIAFYRLHVFLSLAWPCVLVWRLQSEGCVGRWSKGRRKKKQQRNRNRGRKSRKKSGGRAGYNSKLTPRQNTPAPPIPSSFYVRGQKQQNRIKIPKHLKGKGERRDDFS